jgi:hypothetical protein
VTPNTEWSLLLDQRVSNLIQIQRSVRTKTDPFFCNESAYTKISLQQGVELVDWVLSNLNLLDRDEAVRFLNILMIYGYIISIDPELSKFKDDVGIYIFQTSYLWPGPDWNVSSKGNSSFKYNLIL